MVTQDIFCAINKYNVFYAYMHKKYEGRIILPSYILFISSFNLPQFFHRFQYADPANLFDWTTDDSIEFE